jgi:hypothetical protein
MITSYIKGLKCRNNGFLILSFVFLMIGTLPAHSQYFGRNKPSYRSFDFKVYESPNFTIYHYFENDSVIHAVANTYEKWYIRHQKLFKDTFEKPSPIIIYHNHPEFQQTTAVGGNIGIGTQGVTEALKNRVVTPVLETNAKTDHVIGHELVHVFHFRALFVDDSLSLNSLRNLPLWLVEGMAEYFSIGSVDAHTAMIMRDAVKQDDFPSLADMTRNFKYNPYRYGHSFVAFLGRTWGDSIIAPLYRETAKFGYERAIERVIGLNARTVSDLWKSANFALFEEYLADTAKHIAIGNKLVSEDNGGHMNLSPSLSPDGKHIAFFSERDLFSLDLFLADAHTGKVIRKLSSSTRNSDIDAFNFFESVGTWSPDGKKFVHVVVRRGQNQLVVVDVDRPRRTRNIAVPGVPSLNNPAWSPDGRTLVLTGLVDGISNLYSFDMETRQVEKLTNDRYSHIHPTWSPDGRYLAFATDKLPQGYTSDTLNYSFFLAMIDMHSPERRMHIFDVFPFVDNVNPVFDSEGQGMYFLSDRDGFRNMYYLDITDESVSQLTDFYTGVSGITMLSPAITVARNTGEISYSHFNEGKYFIYHANKDDFEFRSVDRYDIDMRAATIPPFNRSSRPVVDHFIGNENRDEIFPVDSFEVKPFRPQFGLTFIGSSGLGASTSRFGTGMAGGVAMLFSDIIGFNQLYTMLAVNGEVYDFGGQVGYVNQKRRINWGAMASHIPYPWAWLEYERGVSIGDSEPVFDDMRFVIRRTFEDQFGLFAFYPISTTRRIEVGGSLAWYYFREDIFHNYYNQFGMLAYRDRSRGDVPSGFNLQRLNIGYIGDNSYFGMASPMSGHRYRFSMEKYFGRIDMYNAIADYRQYHFFNPMSVAFRIMHHGRYGSGAQNNLFYPLYLGYWGFLRGFDYGSISRASGTTQSFDHLFGTRLLMTGLELKVPFTGPDRLALISSGFFFTELAWFLDGGVAWNQGQSLVWDGANRSVDQFRYPVFSTGPSLRINLFGALILEPYYAWTFSSVAGPGRGVWGLNFLPGW